MHIYIHIPFCKTICSYCDFCKFIYNKKWIDDYLNELECEIKKIYKNEKIKTLYIGGGTPSALSFEQLEKLFSIIKIFNLDNDYEFTFECNIESIDYKNLDFLYRNKVNRLSIGVQTFNSKYLKFLNRFHTREEVFKKINLAKEIGFKNINIDLIYAIPNQTILELNNDLSDFLSLDINHISTYSLIIEPHTKLYIEGISNIDEEIDYKMYNLICETLKKNGFNHYEVSNFAKNGYESKHNLVYWNNLEYYGFGCGASGYIDNVRYDNTRNLSKYLSGKYLDNYHDVTLNEKIENEFILGFRKIDGINILNFYEKYNFNVLEFDIIKKLIDEEKLIKIETQIFINPKYMYVQNEILRDLIGIDYESQMEVYNG